MTEKILYLLDSTSGIFTDKEYENSNIGESQGMFTEDMILLNAWSHDDVSWRGEYLNGMMKKLGYNIVSANSAPLKLRKKMKELFINFWG